MRTEFAHLTIKQLWIRIPLPTSNEWILHLKETMVSNSLEFRVLETERFFLWQKIYTYRIIHWPQLQLMQRRKCTQKLPSCCFKNAIVVCNTVDLSNFLFAENTIEFNSLTNKLNWSRRFFSLKFLDFLHYQSKNISI